MNSAAELLLHRSHSYLMDVAYTVTAGLAGESDLAPADALALGMTQFSTVSQLLRACLDRGDLATFREVERTWSQMFDDVWVDQFPGDDTIDRSWSDRAGQRAGRETLQLLREREILRFGLAMWAVHLLQADQEVAREDELGEALRLLARHFTDLQWVLDAYEVAQQESERWSQWFLSELPMGEAHFIPTSNKLMLTMVLLALRVVPEETSTPLRPRDWLVWQRDDLDRHLATLVDEVEKWQRVLGMPSSRPVGATDGPPQDAWHLRITRLRQMLDRAVEDQREAERQQIRQKPIDQTRVDLVRTQTLRVARDSRLIRDLFQAQGGLVGLPHAPEQGAGLVARHWAPKSFFVEGSRVMGLDRMGGDLARGAARAERQALQGALPDREPEAPAKDPTRAVRNVIHSMRERGLTPSLILTPVDWRLHQALGLCPLEDVDASSGLVPVAHRTEFDGRFDDVPVLGTVETPDDRLYVMDLPKAASFAEWPSELNSGVRFELLDFDAESAREFIETHPEVKGDRSDQDAVLDLEEKVLISIFLCWRIEPRDEDAAEVVFIQPHGET